MSEHFSQVVLKMHCPLSTNRLACFHFFKPWDMRGCAGGVDGVLTHKRLPMKFSKISWYLASLIDNRSRTQWPTWQTRASSRVIKWSSATRGGASTWLVCILICISLEEFRGEKNSERKKRQSSWNMFLAYYSPVRISHWFSSQRCRK